MPKKAVLWKTLSTNVLFDHEGLRIDEDTVELPNNRKSTYVRFAKGQTPSVIIIAIDAANKVLMQKEYSHPPGKVMWQLPGGSMKSGEDIITAARRELAEESGYGAETCVVLGSYYTYNRRSDQKQHVVLCTDLYKDTQAADEDEFIETYWLSKKTVAAMIASNKLENINALAALNIWMHTAKPETQP